MIDHCVVAPGGMVILGNGLSIANSSEVSYGVCCMPERVRAEADFYNLITATNAILQLEAQVAQLREELAQFKQQAQEG